MVQWTMRCNGGRAKRCGEVRQSKRNRPTMNDHINTNTTGADADKNETSTRHRASPSSEMLLVDVPDGRTLVLEWVPHSSDVFLFEQGEDADDVLGIGGNRAETVLATIGDLIGDGEATIRTPEGGDER